MRDLIAEDHLGMTVSTKKMKRHIVGNVTSQHLEFAVADVLVQSLTIIYLRLIVNGTRPALFVTNVANHSLTEISSNTREHHTAKPITMQ